MLAVTAICDGCGWQSEARNALANAARHHDATGHTVRVEQTTTVIYGNPQAVPPGQTTLDT